MKAVLLFLILSSVAVAKVPVCADLIPMAKKFQQELDGKFIKDCSLTSYPQEFEKYGAEFRDKHLCASLGSIDLELARLQNRETLVKGINKLKEDIKVQKERAENKDKEAAADFADGVTKAAIMEHFLNAPPVADSLLLKALADMPENSRQNADNLKQTLVELCKDPKFCAVPNTGVCGLQKEELTTAFAEISDLIGKGKNLKDEDYQELRSTFVITTPDGATNFRDMYASMKTLIPKLKSGAALTREELKALKDIPDFKNESNTFPFLKKMLAFKDDVPNRFLLERAVTLVGDLKNRQREEMKAKLSVIWSQVKSDADEGTQIKCDAAKDDMDKIGSCLEALKPLGEKLQRDKSKANLAVNLNNLIESLGYSAQYDSKIPAENAACFQDSNLKAALAKKELPDCLKEIDLDEAKLQEEIEGLQAIKNKILADHEDTLAFRNHTVDQLLGEDCNENVSEGVSKIGECLTPPSGTITPEVSFLAIAGADISIAYVRGEGARNIEKFCGDLDKESPTLTQRKGLCDNEVVSGGASAVASGSGIPDRSEDMPKKGEARKPDEEKEEKTPPRVQPVNYGMQDTVRQGLLGLLYAGAGIFAPPPAFPYYNNKTSPYTSLYAASTAAYAGAQNYQGFMASYYAQGGGSYRPISSFFL